MSGRYACRHKRLLESRAVNDLHVNRKLSALISNNQDTDRASARIKSLFETGPEIGLVNDGESLLDITL